MRELWASCSPFPLFVIGWGIGSMTEGSIIKFNGDELNLIIRGQDRIENDIREIRKDLSDLKDKVALKSDMYKILGLMVLAAAGSAAVVVFVLGRAS